MREGRGQKLPIRPVEAGGCAESMLCCWWGAGVLSPGAWLFCYGARHLCA